MKDEIEHGRKLLAKLVSVLDEGTIYTAHNEDIGDIQLRQGNKRKGLAHIIKRRYEERALNKSVAMPHEAAQKEITAITFLVADELDKGSTTKTPRGNWQIERNGIVAVIDKDSEGKLVLTGYDDNKNKKEATDSINAVIAKYGYTPEFLEMYAQVGAVLASYGYTIAPQKPVVNERSPKNSTAEKILYKGATVTIGGEKITCKGGLLEEFRKNYHLLKAEREKVMSLSDEVQELKKQIAGQENQHRQSRTDGLATKIGKEDFEQLEKIKGTAYDSSPVEENPMTEHGSSPISTIPQSAEKSIQSKEERQEKVINERSPKNSNMSTSNTNEILDSFSQIARVIAKDSSMIIKNPVLGDVVFANGTFGNLEKKNTGGFGIKHIIEGRYRKDNMSKEDIAALLYLIKDVVETVSAEDTDKPRLNLRKNGIFVGITRQWMGSAETWVITGFAENDENNAIRTEAADAIKAVNAQYGYAPEFLSISRQVGAVIASVNNITHLREKSTPDEERKSTAEKILYKGATVTIGGEKITCKDGLLEEFRKNYHLLKAEREKVMSLSDEVQELKKQIAGQENQHQQSRTNGLGMGY